MNLLIHDIATAIEREAKDGTTSVDIDPALDHSEQFAVVQRTWPLPRHAARLELEDPATRAPRR